jgi:hypothetical protein
MVETKRPDKWLHISETVDFLATCLNSSGNTVLISRPDPRRGNMAEIRRWANSVLTLCEQRGLIKRTQGRKGGTYAHWQIAVEYAGYLSPELRILVNGIFRERLQKTPSSLKDLWRAAGNAERKSPKDWLLIAETVEFLITCLKGAGRTSLASRPNPSMDGRLYQGMRSTGLSVITCSEPGLTRD